MGKDINHSRNHTSKMFSPWQVADNARRFGLFRHASEFEMMDDDMVKTILKLEKEQKARMERNRDEDYMEDFSLLSQAQNLDLKPSHSSNIQHTTMQPGHTGLSESDIAMANYFATPESQQSPLVTLELSILEKELTTSGGAAYPPCSLSADDPQVIQIYKKIGDNLATYQSGRIPKAFKIIPSLSNWDQILLLTKPSSWTPQATYEATKAFITNIKATQTRQFFQLVLLNNFRTNLLNQVTSLHISLHMAIQKAMLKSPALFLKGFLFPLCESGTCTIQEASTIAQVISQTKIPCLQSATALLKLAELPFTLTNSVLVLSFLEKKRAMPYRVVDTLVTKYFSSLQAKGQEMVLPQIWFHSLYVFVKSYGVDLVLTQKRQLLELVDSIQMHELSNMIKKAIAITPTDEDVIVEEEEEDNDEANVLSDDVSGRSRSCSGSDMAVD